MGIASPLIAKHGEEIVHEQKALTGSKWKSREKVARRRKQQGSAQWGLGMQLHAMARRLSPAHCV